MRKNFGKRVLVLGLAFGFMLPLGGCDPASEGQQEGQARSADLVAFEQVAESAHTPGEWLAGQDMEPTRRIIRNAEVFLVVDSFSGTSSRVRELANAMDGYVASGQQQGAAGEPRSGYWVLRVPAGRLDDALAQAEQIGQVTQRTTDSADVTEAYVDLDSRLRSTEAQEARLLRHLDESTGDLEDILAVERELARVRSEAERMRGRLNVLDELTQMASLTVHVEEIQEYMPAATETPGLWDRASRAWSGSWGAMGWVSGYLLVGTVSAGPWAVIVGPVLLGGWLIWRRVRPQPAG